MRSTGFLGAALAALAANAAAQARFEPPAIVEIEGDVTIDGQRASGPGTLGERALVRTGAGRTAIRLRGAFLYLGANSSVSVMDNRPYKFNRVEILNGAAALLTGSGGSASVVCEDELKLSERGVFRFDLRPIPQSPYGEHECRFRVSEGAASVQLATYPVVLTGGKEMGLNRRCGDMIPTREFSVATRDDLDDWARERDSGRQ